MSSTWRTRLIVIGIIVVLLAAVLGVTAWYKFFRKEPEAAFSSLEERFKYGSIGAESAAGLPYWIWVALPRVFPDLLPGPGGYRSLGIPWEEGHEMPVGFTKVVVGFPRVANNCSVCHATSYRLKPEDTPIYVPGGPGNTSNIQGFLRFLTTCINDPRFNADTLLAEIDQHTHLSLLDKLSYRFGIIPQMKKALVTRGNQLEWMNRPGIPEWGAGRDDAMNLTKYFMTALPWDQTVGQVDFPSIWNISAHEGMNLNWGGETPSPRSVIIDSALGLSADPKTVVSHEEWIYAFLKDKRPPKYPFPINAALASTGEGIYKTQCYSCHAIAPGTKAGKVIDIAEIGTDRNRLDTWTADAANTANKKVDSLGVKRIGLIKTNGYQAVPLEGLWLRGPYLHNGSVPNLRDLLEPVDQRTPVFWRGGDIFDPVNVGFKSDLPDPALGFTLGFRVDTKDKGNGNGGHLYGTTLSTADKTALLEYLKTL